MRLAAVLLAGCATSTTAGAIQRNFGGDLGASIDGHMGIGAIVDKVVVVDADIRGDIASNNSRFALGGSVLGGLKVVGDYRALARAGIWHAVASSASERTVVPSFELALYIPQRADPADSGSKFGWAASGIIVGVREDLDVVAYTTVFIGLQLFLIPGY